MGTLKQEQFPLGWTPNSNESNGDRNGLLRADNLVFTEDGIVGISKGCRAVSAGLSSTGTTLYSKTTLGGNIFRYVAYGGNVDRNTPSSDPTSLGTSVLTSGDTSGAAFASAWGHTVILSGTQKKLDDGTIRDIELGTVGTPPVPATPTFISNPPLKTESPASDAHWVLAGIDGVVVASADNYIQCTTGGEEFRVIAHNNDSGNLISGHPFIWDTTNFGATGQDMPNDMFSMDVRLDLKNLEKVRVELILDARPKVDDDMPTATDYYFHEWYADTILDINPNYFDPDVFGYQDTAEFIQKIKDQLEPGISFVNYVREGENFWGIIQCLRSQFKRVGSNDERGWKDIRTIRVTFKLTEVADCYFWKMKFEGGKNGQLNGYYQYLQVNCYESSNFIQRSRASVPSEEGQIIKASALVTPGAFPAHCNRIEIYRSSTQTPGFFLTKVIAPPSTSNFIDTNSDIDLLRDNIPLDYYRATVPNDIKFIVGPTYQRLIFFDLQSMYPGIRYDPGSYDTRHASKICSKIGEVILWVRTVIDGVIMVGTTRDIYQVRGDFAYDEVTGLLNYSIEALGIEQVPVSSACTEYGTTVIYLAEDGWRSIAGSTTHPMVAQISRLYQGFDCHGILQVGLGSNNLHYHSCCVSKGRLLCSVNQSDGSRALHIFDLERKTWTYWKGNIDIIPYHLYTEEDGTVLFTSSGTSRAIYEYDYGQNLGGITGQEFMLRTTFSNNGQANHRKDPMSLTVIADSGNADIKIYLKARKNDGTLDADSSVPIVAKFDGYQSKMFNLAGKYPAIKDFQLEVIPDTTVSTFKFYGFQLDYVDHPQEVNYLFVPHDTLGVAGRKRMPTISMAIDTQGNDVTVTPVIDDSSQPDLIINCVGKRIKHYYFTSDVVGYTRALLLKSATVDGRFELYEVLPHRELEVLPDPIKYKALPSFNFGTTKRKRIVQMAFEIDTRGKDVYFTPQWTVNGTWTTGTPALYNTPAKRTVLYYFPTSTIAIDVAGVLESSTAILTGRTEFEFYGLVPDQMVSEPLPAATTYLHIPATNFGTTKRKRFIQYGFVIDTKGQKVKFTPYIDGVAQPTSEYTTNYKDTVFHYFKAGEIGIDIHGTLESVPVGTSPPVVTEFEFYGLAEDQMLSETLPVSAKYLHIPYNNFGTTKRKRFIQYGIVIDTKGNPVQFTPLVDGQSATPQVFTTYYKDTVTYFASENIVGQDLGGVLKIDPAIPEEFATNMDFEFYGVAFDQTVSEALPAATKNLHVNFDNLGTPNKKRIRTIAFVIDTHGADVTFTPTLDGEEYPPSVHNTTSKRTVFHYFMTDVFVVDVEGRLESETTEFEYYGATGNWIVETLPIGRVLDQTGPYNFHRQARLYGFRLQIINDPLPTPTPPLPPVTSVDLIYRLFNDDVLFLQGTITCGFNIDKTYEVNFVKGVNINTFRYELQAASPFYRLKFQLKVDATGGATDNKWINL